MEPWELAAREAIRDLVARYAQGVDRGRFDEVAGLFTDAGVLQLSDDRRAEGRTAIAAVFAHAGGSLRAATATPLVRHHVTSQTIVLETSIAARGVAYFLVLTGHGLDHWGLYHDRYYAIDGRWHFQSRHVRLDGTMPGSWAAARRGPTT